MKTRNIKLVDRYKKDYQYILQIILLLQLILATSLSIFIFIKITDIPLPEYFSITERQQLINPLPLNVQSMNNAELLNLVAESITESFSFNYNDMDRHILKMKMYYNELGYKSYIDFLTNNSKMKEMKAKKLIVYAIPLETPKVLDDLVVDGRHIWQFELPVNIIYQNKIEGSIQDRVVFIIYALRVPEWESPNGILIYKIESA